MTEGLHGRVDETLKSLDSLQRAEANPFLYSKIRSRMHEVKAFVPQTLVWRMVAALAFVALLNVLTLRHFNSNENKQNGAESVATEYAISLPQTY